MKDPEGTELPSVMLAREEAILAAREILAGKMKRGELVDGQQFEIYDSWGNKLITVPFRLALRLD